MFDKGKKEKRRKGGRQEGKKPVIARRKEKYLYIPCAPALPCAAESYKKIENNTVTLTQMSHNMTCP